MMAVGGCTSIREEKKLKRYWGTAIEFLFHFDGIWGRGGVGNWNKHWRRFIPLNKWTNWKLVSHSNWVNASFFDWLFWEDSMVQCDEWVCVSLSYGGHRDSHEYNITYECKQVEIRSFFAAVIISLKWCNKSVFFMIPSRFNVASLCSIERGDNTGILCEHEVK